MLRDIQASDRKDLFIWRNDETVREMSFNKAPIGIEEHNRWFEKAINDPCMIFYVGEMGCEKIGVVRFDKVKDSTYETSVNLASKYRGEGLGRLLIKEGCVKLISEKGAKEITASVKAENPASINAFTKAGFVKIGEANGIVKVCFKELNKWQAEI